jgi:type IV secretion system protein VirD4
MSARDQQARSGQPLMHDGLDLLLAAVLLAGAYKAFGPVKAAAALAVLAIVGLCWIRIRHRPDGFATRTELHRALTQTAARRRSPVTLPLGRAIGHRLSLAVAAEDSVLVLAAPRQGKTSQVIIPWLTDWPGPALVTSLRTDVLTSTATLREDRGPVSVLAPTGMVSWPDRVRWSPTRGCADLDTARRRASVLITVGHAEKQDSSNAGYFSANAVNLWLHAADVVGLGMHDVLKWSLDERDDTPVTLLRDHPDAARGAAELADALYRTPPETRSGLWTTAAAALAPLLSPAAQAVFCPEPGEQQFDPAEFLRSNGTVYLLVEGDRARALAPLITVFLDELLDIAKRTADATPGGRLASPLAIFGDEIANVAPLPQLPGLMSYAGGSGIFTTVVLQSKAQAEQQFGHDQAAMIWGAATVKLVLGGVTGPELRELSELSGDHDHAETGRQTHPDGSITTSTSTQRRRVLEPAAIRTLRPDRREALVLHATTPAVTVRMTRHYEGPNRHRHATAEQEARRIIEATRGADTNAT